MRKTLVAIPGVLEAAVAGVAPDGRPLLSWGQGRDKGVAATAVWMPQPIDWSACRGMRVLVGFLEGDEGRPVLLGLLDTPPPGAWMPAAQGPLAPEEPAPRTLRLEGTEEIILECGKAKIHLRADGTVMVLGERVLSRSKGVNRIKGGSVQIN